MAVVLVLLMRTFLVEGLLTRFVVSSASMSPALHGPHYVLCCPECATVFCVETGDEVCTAPIEPPLRWGTCPACAFARVPVTADAWRPGDRIRVNRAALSLRAVRRWDTVLFRSPVDGTPAVKRVVGLPGETLEIRNGDIFINGRIAVKPLAVQRAMRIPVQYGRWETQPEQPPETMELAWHPIRNTPHIEPVPEWETNVASANPLYGVTSQLCENQWRIEPPGGICPVHDLMLEFDWLPEGKKGLWLEAGGMRLHLLPPQASSPRPQVSKIEISLFDRQLLAAVDGAIIVELPIDELPRDDETQTSANIAPFTIILPENDGLTPEEQEAAFARQITNLCVWRDVYYTHIPANAATTRVTIPAGCYYLLGDNSGFSSDSRVWHEPFVTQRHLVGFVSTCNENSPRRREEVQNAECKVQSGRAVTP